MKTLQQKCAKHLPNKYFVLKTIKILFLRVVSQNNFRKQKTKINDQTYPNALTILKSHSQKYRTNVKLKGMTLRCCHVSSFVPFLYTYEYLNGSSVLVH